MLSALSPFTQLQWVPTPRNAVVHQALNDCLADAITPTPAASPTPAPVGHGRRYAARDEAVEYLVLAGSTLVLKHADERGPLAVTDDREALVGAALRGAMDAESAGTAEHADALRGYVEAMRAHHNQPEGFWVAAADPAAAYASLTGSVPRADLTGVPLLSDGASRLVDRFELTDRAEALRLIREQGPTALIRDVRAAELSDTEGWRWPRGKTHDDTAVVRVTP
ncbi:integrase [Kitasatospora indigofera]|uniref:integrase n=1 Tax=Kitasatospora indigofera TaxID=67307 RepID=UPI00369270D1